MPFSPRDRPLLALIATSAHVSAAASGSPVYGAIAAPFWAAAGMRAAYRAAFRVAYGAQDDPARDPLRLVEALVWTPSLLFACAYHSIRLANPDAYAEWPAGSDGPLDAFLAALVCSLSTSVCVGVGWLGPVAWYARLVAIAQIGAVSCGVAALVGKGRDGSPLSAPAPSSAMQGVFTTHTRPKRASAALPPPSRIRLL